MRKLLMTLGMLGLIGLGAAGATVAFAGSVGGQLFVTLDHGAGLTSTYSWLDTVTVRKGDVVARGQSIATTGVGHPGSAIPHLHLGVKLDDAYVDPLDYLSPIGVQDLIRLAHFAAEGARGPCHIQALTPRRQVNRCSAMDLAGGQARHVEGAVNGGVGGDGEEHIIQTVSRCCIFSTKSCCSSNSPLKEIHSKTGQVEAEGAEFSVGEALG